MEPAALRQASRSNIGEIGDLARQLCLERKAVWLSEIRLIA